MFNVYRRRGKEWKPRGRKFEQSTKRPQTKQELSQGEGEPDGPAEPVLTTKKQTGPKSEDDPINVLNRLSDARQAKHKYSLKQRLFEIHQKATEEEVVEVGLEAGKISQANEGVKLTKFQQVYEKPQTKKTSTLSLPPEPRFEFVSSVKGSAWGEHPDRKHRMSLDDYQKFKGRRSCLGIADRYSSLNDSIVNEPSLDPANQTFTGGSEEQLTVKSCVRRGANKRQRIRVSADASILVCDDYSSNQLRQSLYSTASRLQTSTAWTPTQTFFNQRAKKAHKGLRSLAVTTEGQSR